MRKRQFRSQWKSSHLLCEYYSREFYTENKTQLQFLSSSCGLIQRGVDSSRPSIALNNSSLADMFIPTLIQLLGNIQPRRRYCENVTRAIMSPLSTPYNVELLLSSTRLPKQNTDLSKNMLFLLLVTYTILY